MLFYRAAVDLSRSMLNYVAGIIRSHRKAIRSTWRRLNPAQQALLVLVYLRKGETFTELGAGFGVSAATAWRYVEETIGLLRARAPKLRHALRSADRDGLHYLVLDGMLVHTDRVRADRPYYSAKHRTHGMNIQVIASPDGTIIWTSGSLPGSTHDLTAARIWGILRALEQAGILTLADKGYQGAEGPVATPYKGRDKPASQKTANRSHARLRGPGERANAQLKSWRILRKLRCCPHKAGKLCKAIAVLQNYEFARG
ncbi:IS5/IS1182 family transposase [Nonomuraea sp. WAC 01424]|uniref:transposase family protein n=1 Tax=Nonomuraea sp. WAC 01424 TaxID=2203200 RepID=UPI000F7753EE|nr:transposase family protein [Nonomuraea sp. WAC 01424]RSN15702.1 IS5/IS1182 family transposase [Nonomuraea sp. WAC 01424]